MRIVSVFDGMACGYLAMLAAGIKVDRYVAYEIDKYAVQTSSHNFPIIEHKGDVFQADFTEYSGFDFLVGGSPCTYWSIAQKNNRETVASGMGWELFCQYVRALHEVKPMWFIYENNKSMSNAIRESITETFGFEPICINSALVSAQNRQRLYWVGKRNPDGTYSRVHVDQPKDRGIFLRDILDGIASLGATQSGKGYCLTASYSFGMAPDHTDERGQNSLALEPVALRDKAYTIDSNYHKTLGQQGFDTQSGRRKMVAEPVNASQEGKAQYYKNGVANFVTNGGFDASAIAEPCRVGTYPNEAKNQKHDSQQYRIYSPDAKSVTLCGNGGGMGAKTGLYAIQCCSLKVKEATSLGYAEIQCGNCVDMQHLNSKTRRGRNMTDKSNCLQTSHEFYQYCGVLGYATPIEWNEDGIATKAISGADGKVYTVYEVKDGNIVIKGKSYPIQLVDGFYIIRNLTVSECKRLQTVPEWYEFPVSDSQSYKMLGNGWTVDVIAHLITATQDNILADQQLSLFTDFGGKDEL